MKNVKKCDLKKLAMLGIATGTMLATEGKTEAADINNYDNLLAFAGCANHGCGGAGDTSIPNSSKPISASYYYRDTPQASSNTASQQSPQGQQSLNQQPGMNQPRTVSSGCGAQSRPQGQQSWNQQPGMNQPQQVSSGCGAQSRPQGQQSWNQQPGMNQPQQVSSGCGAQSRPQGQQSWGQPQRQVTSGCGAQQGAPGQPSSWSKTSYNYTADNPSPAPMPSPDQSGQPQGQDTKASQQSGSPTSNRNMNMNKGKVADASKPMAGQAKLSESELLSQLNESSKAVYKGMDPAGKALALKLANQTCQGKNECKGLNSCKTEKNSCAGQGSCAGTSIGPFKDKNLAVKVAAQKMAAKRGNAASPK